MTSETEDGVEVRQTGRGKFQVEVKAHGTSLIVDEPVEAGGLGSGPSPYDLLASALGACTLMTLRLYAERKGWPLKAAVVRVLHRRDALEAQDRFAREILLEGDLTSEQHRRLLEIADRCPVHQTLERGSKIVTVLVERPFTGDPTPLSCSHAKDMLQACEE